MVNPNYPLAKGDLRLKNTWFSDGGKILFIARVKYYVSWWLRFEQDASKIFFLSISPLHKG